MSPCLIYIAPGILTSPRSSSLQNAATSTLKASATPGITQASTDTGQEDAFLGSLHQTRVRERLVIEAMEMK